MNCCWEPLVICHSLHLGQPLRCPSFFRLVLPVCGSKGPPIILKMPTGAHWCMWAFPCVVGKPPPSRPPGTTWRKPPLPTNWSSRPTFHQLKMVEWECSFPQLAGSQLNMVRSLHPRVLALKSLTSSCWRSSVFSASHTRLWIVCQSDNFSLTKWETSKWWESLAS